MIYFGRVIEHYRIGVYETVAQSGEFGYTFCYGLKKGWRSLKVAGDELSHPFLYRRSWQLKLPFVNLALYFQPAEITAALGSRYDVIISTLDYRSPSAVLCLVLSKLTGKRVIMFGHGVPRATMYGRGAPRGLKWRLRRFFAALADAVLIYGKREYDFYARDRFNVGKVFTTNNALDTRPARKLRTSVTQADLDAFRAENGLTGKRVLLYVGRLIRDKRLGEAIEAMPAVLREVPDAKLVLIGDGPDRERLEGLVGRLGRADAVELPGAIYDEEVLARYYMSSELAVCPGAVGLLVNQAFAYGVPVVVNDSQSHGPEIAMVRPGRTGAFFRAHDVEDFARSVVGLLGKPELLRRMGLECMRLIDEEYNEDRMAKGFDDAVRYALAH